MSLELWFAFFITEFLLCLSPGPAVLMVIATGITRGVGMSIWSNLGILAGNTIYFILSATSLGALLLASYDIFFAVKWIGAAYLVYLGVMAWLEKDSVMTVPKNDDEKRSPLRIFLNAVVLQLSNPKTLLFFIALLPQFIDAKQFVTLQIAIMGVTSVVLEFFVLLAYGVLAGKASHYATQPRFVRITNRLSGSLLVGAGLGLAALSKK